MGCVSERKRIRLPSTTCGWLSRRHVLHDERPARDTAWGLRGEFSLAFPRFDLTDSRPQPFLVHKVYQLDYSRTEGRFRMLDRLKPREMAERAEGGGGAWYPSVGVQRVTWHDGAGLTAAGMLASATGSGLCRVDLLEGRWFRDRCPYERVEAMRMEVDGMEVDEPEDNDESS
jgi:hypothetical protein